MAAICTRQSNSQLPDRLRVAADGQLRVVSDPGCARMAPRSAAIDPSGTLLFSCNNRGDDHVVPDQRASGALQFTGLYEPVGSPACMVILQPH